MSVNDVIKIIWKTKCKWRDTEDFAKRKDIRPGGVGVKQDFATMPLKPGDAVRIRFARQWYDGEVLENWNIEDREETDKAKVSTSSSKIATIKGPYEQFLEQQAKREEGWKEEYSKNRQKSTKSQEKKKDATAKKQKPPAPVEVDSSVQTDSISVIAGCKEQLRLKNIECEGLKKKVETIHQNSIDWNSINDELKKMQSSIMAVLLRMEHRLETIETLCANIPMARINDSVTLNSSEEMPDESNRSIESTVAGVGGFSTIDLEDFIQLRDNSSSSTDSSTRATTATCTTGKCSLSSSSI